MSQALAFVPEADTSGEGEYNDFTRRELAIALNSAKRGRIFLEIINEEEKDDPDKEKIDRLSHELSRLEKEQYNVYTGDALIQQHVIDTYRHE